MPTISETVIDQDGRPVSSAQVTIRTTAGALVDIPGGNPRITNSEGLWTAVLEVGNYSMVITKGTSITSRTLNVFDDQSPAVLIEDEVTTLTSETILTNTEQADEVYDSVLIITVV